MFAEQIFLFRCRHRLDVDADKLERKLLVLRKREAAEQYMPGERSLALARRVEMSVALRNQLRDHSR